LYFVTSSKKGLLPTTTLTKLAILFVLFSVSSWLESVTFTIVTITYIAIALEQHIFEKTRLATKSLKAKDVYCDLEKLICFQHSVLNNSIISIAYQSFQPFFPIMLENNLVGIIKRKTLLKSANRAGDIMLSELSEKEFTVIDLLAPLSDALELFQIKDTDFLLVADKRRSEKICGIISKEKMFEYLMLKSESITDNQMDATDSF
jgi:hypothetical protein